MSHTDYNPFYTITFCVFLVISPGLLEAQGDSMHIHKTIACKSGWSKDSKQLKSVKLEGQMPQGGKMKQTLLSAPAQASMKNKASNSKLQHVWLCGFPATHQTDWASYWEYSQMFSCQLN